MIQAVLFDFGGTLDSDGGHWLDRFFRIYEQIGLGHLPKDQVKEAFYWADVQAENDPSFRSVDLRTMMQRHVRWQFQKLVLTDTAKEIEASQLSIRPMERMLHRNRMILETLHFGGLKLGIVSNFYGNIATLCHEFGYTPLMQVMLDSAVEGLKKPDLQFFKRALDQMGLAPSHVAFVGDSFERDIVPAKQLGMQTYWLIGDEQKFCPDPAQVDFTLRSLEELPALILPKHRETLGART